MNVPDEPQQLLVSDANILIDMQEGGLLHVFFKLPYEFIIPDILFEEELADDHPDIPDQGLRLVELSGELMLSAMQMIDVYRKPSRNDIFAMCLAMDKRCPLLTGDKDLRDAAMREGIEVQGTIRMVSAMIDHELITKEEARQAYDLMRNAGRRLPWKRADESLHD
ncbi:PIN domain-containing protein [Aliidiomarina sp.]|uniref:PIN domain-containing protein n=1 Tax=Aliidiomarina sp. TaxID=1872439 RepID=UPI003A4E4ACE